MIKQLTRRRALGSLAAVSAGLVANSLSPSLARAAKKNPKWEVAMHKGLKWVSQTQSSLGHWTAGSYPTAMTALAGTALICSGSTTTQGPYAKNIRLAVDYLTSKSRGNGLIGDPLTDNRYTYGHGFSMLFLSMFFSIDFSSILTPKPPQNRSKMDQKSMSKSTSILTSFFNRCLIDFHSKSEGPTPQNH